MVIYSVFVYRYTPSMSIVNSLRHTVTLQNVNIMLSELFYSGDILS